MKQRGTKALAMLLSLVMVLSLVPALSATACADSGSDYTFSIPSSLTVQNAGENAAGNISVTALTSGKKLTVSAASTNGWALKSGDNSVGYSMSKTSWEFTAAGSEAFSITVEDYSSKPAGTYQDTVTFTACVRNETIIWTEQTFNDNRKGEFTADGITVTPTYNGANYPRYSNNFYSWGYNKFTAPEGKKFTEIVIESSGEIELVDFSGATYTADFPTREEATEIVKKMYGDDYEMMYEEMPEMIEEEIQDTMNRADSIITTWTGSTDTIRFRAGIENVSKITFTLE